MIGELVKELYTKKEVAEITRLAYRNVQFYTEQGVVVPEVEAGGRGRFRMYSNHDLISFLVAGEMAAYGMTISEIRKNIRALRFFWSLKVDFPKGDTLKLLSRTPIELRFGRAINKTRLTMLSFGKDKAGNALQLFSMSTSPDGKVVREYRINQKDGEPHIVTVDENQTVIKDFDFGAPFEKGLVSYVYIAVNELIDDMLKRLP